MWFFQISETFGNIFIKTYIICLYLQFIYQTHYFKQYLNFFVKLTLQGWQNFSLLQAKNVLKIEHFFSFFDVVLRISNIFFGNSMQCMNHNNQSFPDDNHHQSYRNFTSRSCPVLFTITDFFLIHTLSSSAEKFVVIAALLSKLDHRSLFS